MRIRHSLTFVLAVLLSISLTSCGPSISKEQYIKAMSELGCSMLSETSPEAAELYQKMGITQDEIMQFRQKTKIETMTEAANAIATNVAKCHGINLSAP